MLTSDLYKIYGALGKVIQTRIFLAFFFNFYNLYVFLDHGYYNLHIDTTTPKIGDVINRSETSLITIKYYEQVDLTPDYNVTIIQDDGSINGIIRQVASVSDDGNNNFVTISDDGTTINITVINSTFNQPGGKYYISIDKGFVRDRKYQEPLIGINTNVWSFTTRRCSIKF